MHHAARRAERMGMGTIIEFPADAGSGRLGSTPVFAQDDGKGTVLILPVVCIARESDGTSGSQGPQADAAPSRRRRCRR